MVSSPKARRTGKQNMFNQQFRRIDAICRALHRAVMAELTAETLEKRLETERVKTLNKTRATAKAESTATASPSGTTAPSASTAVAGGGGDGDEHGSLVLVSNPSEAGRKGAGLKPSCTCFSNAPGGGDRSGANLSQPGLEVDGADISLPCGHGGAALDKAAGEALAVRNGPPGDLRRCADIRSDYRDGDGRSSTVPTTTTTAARAPPPSAVAAEARMGVPFAAVSAGATQELTKAGHKNSFTFLEDLLRARHPKGNVSRGPPPKAKRKSLVPRGTVDDGKDDRRSSKKPKETGGAASGPFSGLSLCVVHLGSVTKNTIKAFARGVRDGGGQLSTHFTPGDTTHIVADASLDAIWDKLDLYFSGWDDFEEVDEGARGGAPDTVPIVSSAWMSECLRLSSVVALDAYRLTPPPRSETERAAAATTGRQQQGDGNAINNTDAARGGLASSAAATAAAVKMRPAERGGEINQSAPKEENHERDVGKPVDGGKAVDGALATSSESMMVKGGFGARNPNVGANKHKFLCQMSSSVVQKVFNKEAAEMLERLAELCAARGGDGSVFRERGFKNAAGALKRLGVEITDVQQLKDLRRSEPDRVRGIGDSVMKELDSFYSEGKMHRLDGMEADPKLKCLELFNKISWVGEVTAQKLYSEGMRSIEDVRERGQHLLNEQARICLSRHEDISQRMPRAEAAEIEAMVTKVAQSISPGVICQACGSYRRGKSHCGDVDVLIRPPEGQEDSPIFHELIEKLTESGFVTDHLAVPRRQYTPGKSQTFMGICKLPGDGRLHRRLDIKLYPTSMFAFAVLYFTGSGHFNMSMRSFAKIKGLKLSDKGLCRVNSVGGKEVHKFPSYRCLREEDVFTALGLDWREPRDRDGVQVEAYTSWGAEGAVELSGRVVPMTLAHREEYENLQDQTLPTTEEGCFHANTNQYQEQQLTRQMRGQAELFFLEQEQLRQAIHLSRSGIGPGRGSRASPPQTAAVAKEIYVDGAPGDDQIMIQEALRRSVADTGAAVGGPVWEAGAGHEIWEKLPPEAMAKESKSADADAAASNGGRGAGAGSEHSPVCL